MNKPQIQRLASQGMTFNEISEVTDVPVEWVEKIATTPEMDEDFEFEKMRGNQ